MSELPFTNENEKEKGRTLSDKMIITYKGKSVDDCYENCYFEEDVKDSIQNVQRRLNKELRHNILECELKGVQLALKCVKTMDREIDKLAGEDLK